MSVQHNISLLFKAAHIERQIAREQSMRNPDWERLLRLKKLRLALKDRIRRLLRPTDQNRASDAPSRQHLA
jgi:uncharacterized protein YdcH (DUF465 family)